MKKLLLFLFIVLAVIGLINGYKENPKDEFQTLFYGILSVVIIMGVVLLIQKWMLRRKGESYQTFQPNYQYKQNKKTKPNKQTRKNHSLIVIEGGKNKKNKDQ